MKRRSLSVVTLNIAGPSLERGSRLADHLLELDSDVLVLTETRSSAGTERLLQGLMSGGYTVEAPTVPLWGERGAAIATRLPCEPFSGRPLRYLPHRLPQLVVSVGCHSVLVVGAYVPSRDASTAKVTRKREFLASLVEHAGSLSGGSVLLLGDLNVVGRSHEPRYKAFRSWEYDALEELRAGYVDAYQLVAPGVQAHSWIGRHGDGYQYDYGFVSGDLASAVVACSYDHSSRQPGLTDHAAVRIQLELERLETRASAPTADGLVAVSY